MAALIERQIHLQSAIRNSKFAVRSAKVCGQWSWMYSEEDLPLVQVTSGTSYQPLIDQYWPRINEEAKIQSEIITVPRH